MNRAPKARLRRRGTTRWHVLPARARQARPFDSARAARTPSKAALHGLEAPANFFAATLFAAGLVALAGPAAALEVLRPAEIVVMTHSSDASAIAWAGEGLLVVADDEDNILRFHDPGREGAPLRVQDIHGALGIAPRDENPEADLEGATRVGDRLYFITSHGRNRNGRERENRLRFAAFDLGPGGELAPVAPARPDLVHHLLEDPRYGGLGLHESTRFGEDLRGDDRRRLAPKDEGFNIEGLSSTADGSTLFIGLRNPRPPHPQTGAPHAVVATLLNADAFLADGAPPRFGPPLLWDLGGLGIRAMERDPAIDGHWIIAGPPDDGGPFVLYRWDEHPAAVPRRAAGLPPGYAFESLVPLPDGSGLWLASDDGGVMVPVASQEDCLEELENGACRNKDLADPARRTWRLVRVQWDDPPGGG